MNFDDSIEAEQGVTGTMLPAEQGVAAGMSAAEQGVAAGMPAAEQASAVTTEGAAPATKTSVDAGSDNKELDQGAHGVNQDGNQEDDEENAMDTPNVDTCLESGVMDERVLVSGTDSHTTRIPARNSVYTYQISTGFPQVPENRRHRFHCHGSNLGQVTHEEPLGERKWQDSFR